jgi:hypothetical protein
VTDEAEAIFMRRACGSVGAGDAEGLPIGGGTGTSAWPAYCYEWEDLLAQQAQGELERTQQQQNRIRLLPGLRAITEMELAICWPAEYLGRLSDLLRAVNAVALAHSLERDAGWVAEADISDDLRATVEKHISWADYL